jgi:hypothetical protein
MPNAVAVHSPAAGQSVRFVRPSYFGSVAEADGKQQQINQWIQLVRDAKTA